MKLSNNSIGMLIFIALATTVFVLMVLRPVVDGNAMNLGVPVSGEMAAVDTSSETDTTIDTTAESPSAVIKEVDISQESVEEEEADKATEESSSATIPTKEIIEEAPSESTTTTN